jgi:outer membrane protein assembly factor BamE (lipoprotein component of BamABCDE complex)
MKVTSARIHHTAMLLVAGLALGACSKITAANYAKIKSGMSYDEVTQVLGSPARCDDVVGFKSCQWGEEKSGITVRFAADKVVLHSAVNIR